MKRKLPAKINIASPQIFKVNKYLSDERLTCALLKKKAIVIFTNTILTKNEIAYAKGAIGSESAAVAIKGPPISNQKIYAFGFNKFVKIPFFGLNLLIIDNDVSKLKCEGCSLYHKQSIIRNLRFLKRHIRD